MYKMISSYILSNEQLQQNGFPIPDPQCPEKVTLKIPDYVKPACKDRKYLKILFYMW